MLSLAPILAATRPHVRSRAYVLLVDDHAQSLQGLSTIVRSAGHPCETAATAAEAISRCDAQRPQVVVTDLMMPNLDGRGLAGWVQARSPSLPLILMTGQDLDAATLAELRRTFTAVLRKPLEVEPFLG